MTKQKSKITFLCYDRCTTCQKAKKWLDAKGASYETRPIKEQNPTAKELAEWIKKVSPQT